MLSHLILDNFKAFGTRQVIPLAPITLIFGANSAGKSSILQSLLLLKQTLAEAETGETLLLPKGDLVDLGSYREIVFGHEKERVCEVTPLTMPRPGEEQVAREALWPYRLNESGPRGLGIRFGYDEMKGTLKLVSVPNYLGKTDLPAYELVPGEAPSGKGGVVVRRSRAQVWALSEYARFVRVSGVIASHPCWAELFSQFTQEFQKGFANDLESALKSFQGGRRYYPGSDGREQSEEVDEQDRRTATNNLEDWLIKLDAYGLSDFISDAVAGNSSTAIALRNFLPDEVPHPWFQSHPPEFAYRNWIEFDGISDSLPEPNLVRMSLSLGQSLRKALDDLVYVGPRREIPERYYTFSGNPARAVGKSGRMLPDLLYSHPDLLGETNEELRAFQVGYQVQVHRMSDAPVEGAFALSLIDERTGTRVGMTDVGFGVWQVLPVIVESLAARGKTVLMEEPEIHLHPRLQADLGNLFMLGIAEPRRNQFIIETHSEHLILRIQRLIRTGELKASDVSVIYVRRDSDGSTCDNLRLDENGAFIDRWPHGFFPERFREVFGRR